MKKILLVLTISLLAFTACATAPTQSTDAPTDTSTPSPTTTSPVTDKSTAELTIKESVKEEKTTFQYNAILEDVSGGVATGTAGASFSNDTYKMLAEFQNLPDLEDDFFYEGWVVSRSPLSVISTGEAVLKDGNYINSFTFGRDLTDHNLYVLTLEPDDGDPAPAEHILEGTLSMNSN